LHSHAKIEEEQRLRYAPDTLQIPAGDPDPGSFVTAAATAAAAAASVARESLDSELLSPCASEPTFTAQHFLPMKAESGQGESSSRMFAAQISQPAKNGNF